MALIVEDGTVVADADTFVSTAYVATYALNRGIVFTGTSAQQEVSCRRAFDWLSNELRLRYVGTKATSAQRAPWPRVGASENDGASIGSNEIPWRVKVAQAELAILDRLGITLQEDLENGGLLISSESVDVISTSYFQPERMQMFSRVPGESVRVGIMGFLAPLLRNVSQMRVSPTFYAPVDATPFIPGEFDST